MKAHKRTIIISAIVFAVLGVIALYLESMNLSEKYAFWINVSVGVWCSNFVVLVIEIVNYQTVREDLLVSFYNDAQNLYNRLLAVRLQSGQNGTDLSKVILKLSELDFAPIFYYRKFSFFTSWKRFNKYKHLLDDIQNSLVMLYDEITRFSNLYNLLSEDEQKTLKKQYLDLDRKILDDVREHLSKLRLLIQKS
ncbi:MAG: hypothetical protein HOD49_06065 [Anaerolineae bacterium]|jgi:hypothetical protein|nr:hypothetical protein [Anaerolineae bacterium]